MFSAALARRAAEGKPVRVGIIGAGKFGGGLLVQLAQMKGMAACAVADRDLERARRALLASGVTADAIQLVESAGALADAIHRGKCAIAQDGLLVAGAEPVEVVVEATGIPEVGARLAYEAIQQGKHVVMVNVEADVTVGPLLRRLADRAGVVYTLVDGDQPGVIMNMVEWARTLGFEVVAAGRGTLLYADDREGTPDTVPQRFGFDAETLARRSINLKMFNSFRDGTKSQVEMTALANMAGLVPDVRGMHEPAANIRDLARIFSRREEGGILGQHGVVELANSVAGDGRTLLDDPLKMGVFAVIRAEHPFIQEDLKNYYLHSGGEGHNFLLYRPYHLVAVEAPISIAKAALYGQPTGAPLPTPVAEVITVAKRELKQGEVLDGSGGYTVYGLCEQAEVARAHQFLPLGLADRARLTQPVRRGEAITYGMVELDEESFVLKLRRLQDATVW
ncbi:MAG: NAD(P)-dependent oxidoreductase [Candidatus Latescibacteria bacterium]|nr:NAD(P)-dependent oxidoreductase [Candidatus Latescibacterota bacterium]